jgi:8-oxo-dGTP diphosphatase
MNRKIPQFGEPLEKYLERPGAYAVIFKENKVLVLNVEKMCHLPGGGIDEGEDEESALRREVLEETGYEINNLMLIGRANQFFPKAKLGPLNKIGVFYRAEIVSQNQKAIINPDHIMVWLVPTELENTPMAEFQKWAVREALK